MKDTLKNGERLINNAPEVEEVQLASVRVCVCVCVCACVGVISVRSG